MSKKNSIGIQEPEHLARRLGWTPPELERVAEACPRLYRYWAKEKPNGRIRKIYEPKGELKLLQGLINRRLLQSVVLPDSLHGSRKGRSIVTNMAPHVGQEVVMTLDIKNYFPSISHCRVYELFMRLGCSPDVARLLTRLTTHKGHVPQGTPTASSIANLVTAIWIEPRLRALCEKEGFNLTIYVDDISVSGPYRLIGFRDTLLEILTSAGFRYRKDKVHIQTKGQKQVVTGHTVNQGMAPTREWRDGLRAQIHRLAIDAPSIPQGERIKRVRRIRGRVNHLRQFMLKKAETFENRLALIG
ncbi:MAG: hypothetical protein HDKAJFGB_03998 [Anaerolineae bacterium]|nr:hypothetical protein [Anaerolineae bacterium]